jgi:hypothetical protein
MSCNQLHPITYIWNWIHGDGRAQYYLCKLCHDSTSVDTAASYDIKPYSYYFLYDD